MVVGGGGPAGLTAAITAARAGHTVALAERNLTGGTCVNFGCTPSKALLRAAGRCIRPAMGKSSTTRSPQRLGSISPRS